MQARLIGVAVLLFGLALGQAFAPVPYQSPPDPLFDVGAFLIAALAVVFGLLLLVSGDRLYRIINSPAKSAAQKRSLLMLYGLAAMASVAALFWYHSVTPIM